MHVKSWIKDHEIEIISRAWESDGFKQNLITQPVETLRNEFNVQLSGEINIQVLEEKHNILYFVLPMNQEPLALDELQEDELQYVAGGHGEPPNTTNCGD